MFMKTVTQPDYISGYNLNCLYSSVSTNYFGYSCDNKNQANSNKTSCLEYWQYTEKLDFYCHIKIIKM